MTSRPIPLRSNEERKEAKDPFAPSVLTELNRRRTWDSFAPQIVDPDNGCPEEEAARALPDTDEDWAD